MPKDGGFKVGRESPLPSRERVAFGATEGGRGPLDATRPT